VSVPPHAYAAAAGAYLSAPRVQSNLAQCTAHRAATRAYTRVVLRLRAQAEAQAEWDAYYGARAAGHAALAPLGAQWHAPFRSALFRLRRAPLLRVFVPSAEGDWLTDEGVLECEAELAKAGVKGFMREGDVVWDTAIGDEGGCRDLYTNSGLIRLKGILADSYGTINISSYVRPSAPEPSCSPSYRI
jgi:hypothetical protein